MTTPNYAFNGSTVSFAGTPLPKLLSATYPREVSEVDVSGANEEAIYEAGQLKRSLDLKVVGGVSLIAGAKGAITGTWKDGSTAPAITNALLSKISTEGAKNNPISTTLHFVPSTDA